MKEAGHVVKPSQIPHVSFSRKSKQELKTTVNIGITFNRWPDKGDQRDVRVALFLLDM